MSEKMPGVFENVIKYRPQGLNLRKATTGSSLTSKWVLLGTKCVYLGMDKNGGVQSIYE